MYTYDIITDINNRKFAIIRFANSNDDKADVFDSFSKVLTRVKDVMSIMIEVTHISIDLEVMDYLLS